MNKNDKQTNKQTKPAQVWVIIIASQKLRDGRDLRGLGGKGGVGNSSAHILGKRDVRVAVVTGNYKLSAEPWLYQSPRLDFCWVGEACAPWLCFRRLVAQGLATAPFGSA